MKTAALYLTTSDLCAKICIQFNFAYPRTSSCGLTAWIRERLARLKRTHTPPKRNRLRSKRVITGETV